MESNGRKAWQIRNKRSPTDYGFISIKPGVRATDFEDKIEGRFSTLDELATRDAAMIQAAEARGAAGIRLGDEVTISPDFVYFEDHKLATYTVWGVQKDRDTGELDYTLGEKDGTWLTDGWKEADITPVLIPDTAAHDAATRKEERAKVLEEVTEAVIPKGCHAQGCPLTKAQRTAKKLLAQDKE